MAIIKGPDKKNSPPLNPKMIESHKRSILEKRTLKDAGKPQTAQEWIKDNFVTLLACTVASVIYAFNMNSFVDAGGMYPSGFAGVALLIIRVLQKFVGIALPFSVVYLPLNIVPLYIGFRFIGKKFTIFSLYFTVLSSFLTDILPKFTITEDILLICIFGGLLNALSGVVCLWFGASSGGTNFISIWLSERYGIDAYGYIFAGNVCVLALAGLIFGWEKALYSIIFQYVSTQVYQTLFTRYHKNTLFIITDMPESVYDKISILSGHDATLFKGQGFYKETTKYAIYSVVDSDQVNMLLKEIRDIDPHAFINVLTTDQLAGRFYKRPNQ